mmetsp:Transcript_23949/g.42848  ORF Transcript_23949/g.42848 Transcript_23949/m.42848 type:complete len:631 (+) Transcript_23949:167-2059(+)|eukprot:CAMPEP_0201933026 /NCGR_PEP_ID=MMETSP0903-20130614/30693_1 /ASSEMBLY_ACC=CAM_ASM_000552 /TAXON_ID=420261 /ORGANISM="Thalassiosira antarctica, Strain CCMP982" /LENGTH=630 /DNA_ID=CAMNT_0048472825 /DNA_START=25 /DNA_END=1917 /DNA_ORIENTATION=+
MRSQSLKSTATALVCIALATTGGQQQCHAGWVDPDSPEEALTTTSHYAEDTREYELVFSDEFEQDGRSFEDGADPRWTAIDKNDYTNEALHFYRPENIQTTNGVMNISSVQKSNRYKAFDEKKLKYYADAKHIQSGMVQGWNKFCLTGGIIEFSAKLPGDPETGGLWPALWMLGNLARATYVGSSNFIWPYSYDECDESNRQSQKVSACSKVGHYGMKPGRGRGSPEIDILEAMMGSPEKLPSTNITRPYFSTSLQIAPGLEGTRPNMGKLPKKGHWYEGLEYGSNNTQLNPFFYGVTLEHKPKQFTYQSDAISANTHLAKDSFKHHRKYRVEWEPPNNDGTGGYLKWFLDGKILYGMKGENLQLTGAEIPSEPMYLIMNTAVASSWGFPKPCPDGCTCDCYECGNPECLCGLPDGFCENLPAFFEIDYVRAYQAKNESKHILGCSTQARPTSKFIKGHAKDYMNTEEGQKEPLMAIQRGGRYCSKDSDCGYPTKGACSESNRCVCEDDYTGPKCLSHAGYNDNPPPVEDLEVDRLLLSPVFSFMFFFAAVAFISFVGIAVFKRRRQEMERYNQVPSSNEVTMRLDFPMQQQVPGNGSYQNSPESAYNPMGADKQETVTYCMIDGRLIDE